MSGQNSYYYGNNYQTYDSNQRDSTEDGSTNVNQSNTYYGVAYQQPTRSNYDTTLTITQPSYSSYQQPQQQVSATSQQWYAANRDGSTQAAQALTSMQTNPSQVRINSPAVTPAYNPPVASSVAYPSSVSSPNHQSQAQAPTHSRAHSTADTSAYGATAQQQHNQQLYPNVQAYQAASAQGRPRSVNSVRSQSAAVQSPVIANAGPTQQYTQVQSQHIDHSNDYQSTANQVPSSSSSKSQTARKQRTQQNLPSVSHITQPNLPATTSSYTYSTTNGTAANSRNSGSDSHYAQSMTVDPTAVYDPWPEYQRKLDAARATKAAQDAEAAKKLAAQAAMKAAGEQRLEQERLAEAQRLKEQEEAEKAREEAERERQEAEQQPKADEEKKRQKKEAAAKARERNKMKKQQLDAPSATAESSDVAPIEIPASSTPNDPESALREMMAKIRAMNEAHPDLVAKIWEEERQSHIQKGAESPVVVQDDESTPALSKAKSKKPSANAPALMDPPVTGLGKKTKKPSKEKSSAKVSGSAQADPAPLVNTATTAPPAPPPTAKYSANIARTLRYQPPLSNEQNGRVTPAISTTTDAGMALSKPQIAKFAAVTVKILSAKFENSHLALDSREIEAVLADNPSYKDFCSRLEAKGYKVDRRSLAQALLPHIQPKNTGAGATSASLPAASQKLSVPGQRNQNLATKVNSTPRWTPSSLPASTTPAPPPLQHGPALPNYEAPGNFRSPYFIGNSQSAVAGYGTPGQQDNDAGIDVIESSAGPADISQTPSVPDPVSKKRTFSALVDLTGNASSDEDDDLPPAKRYQDGPMAHMAPMQNSFLPPHMRTGINAALSNFARPYDQFRPVNDYVRPNIGYPGVPVPGPGPPPLRDDLRDAELCKPLDRSKARRRNWYDVRTIARDVLLATGRHPEMQPLNGHLENIRVLLRGKVPDNADLATIRWDLIDPGEPIPLPELEKDEESIAGDEADDESEQEPIHIAPRVAVRIVAGGHGEESAIAIPDLSIHAGKDIKVPRKRGRPPGSGMKYQLPPGFTSVNAGQSRSSLGSKFVPYNASAGPDEGRRHTFGGNSSSSGQPQSNTPRAGGTGGMNYAEYRAAKAARGEILSNRGRPQGWYPGVVVPPSGPIPPPPARASGGPPNPLGRPPNPPGRPPKPSAGPASRPAKLPDAFYPKFRCQWDLCTAELHNLATLRKHIHKVHKKTTHTGMYECGWDTCGQNTQVFDRVEQEVTNRYKHIQFEDEKSWADHIEDRHIQRIAWQLGDGPAGGMSGTSDSEAYLSDSHGRQTTPRMTVPDDMSQSLSSARAGPIPARAPKLPALTPVEQAKQRMEVVARRRRIIGPGLDKDGATFVTPKMKRGFVEEDFDEMIVVEEEADVEGAGGAEEDGEEDEDVEMKD